jgi:hypothetical protein
MSSSTSYFSAIHFANDHDTQFRFLRVPDQIIERRTWKRLLSPAFCEDFNALFDTRLAVRTTKVQVKDEFQLPMQTRYIVPIEFGKVERTVGISHLCWLG